MTTIAAGDAIPKDCHRIEIRIAEVRQMFNAIDPAPFRERDLDPRAEEFIVGWATDVPRHAPLALLVHVDRTPGPSDEAAMLRDAIHQFFAARANSARRQLRDLFRRGRISLVIATGFLALAMGVADLAASSLEGRPIAPILREGMLIGGWVAMWRPLEIFLYDWWPIRADARLFDRLSAMPVRIEYTGKT
jgi:hypothetical protein